MNTRHKLCWAGTYLLAFAPFAPAVDIISITSFDPNTFFDGGITAGVDFDVDSDGSTSGAQLVTQAGFESINAGGGKTFNVTTNGITFDVVTTNANLGNQNRWRNNANAGALMNDFVQWYGRYATADTNIVESAITMSGLTPNTDYQVSFFTYNVGAGQTTHKFYEGASSADPLITTFTTSGSQNNYSTWSPGITFGFNSGANGEFVITIQASENAVSTNFESRLTLDGISLVEIPTPNDALSIDTISLDTVTDEVTITFVGEANTTYTCKSSTALVDFSTTETPINGTDFTTDGSGNGSFVVSASGVTKFYRMETLP